MSGGQHFQLINYVVTCRAGFRSLKSGHLHTAEGCSVGKNCRNQFHVHVDVSGIHLSRLLYNLFQLLYADDSTSGGFGSWGTHQT